jgi:hypothetical protein
VFRTVTLPLARSWVIAATLMTANVVLRISAILP